MNYNLKLWGFLVFVRKLVQITYSLNVYLRKIFLWINEARQLHASKGKQKLCKAVDASVLILIYILIIEHVWLKRR